MADTNPFLEGFFKALAETSQDQRQKAGFAHEDDPNSMANKHWDTLYKDYKDRYGAEQAAKKIKDTAEGLSVPSDEQGNLLNLFKPGVSGQQPGVTPAQGNAGVPQVGPLGRTQPEPGLVNPPTTGFDVSSTTKPNTSGPPTQADSLNPFAAAMQALMGPQSQAGPPTGADTLGQPTPGLRMAPTQAGVANEMIGQGAGQGAGGGAVSPAMPSAVAPMAGIFQPPTPGQSFVLPDGMGGFRRVNAPPKDSGSTWRKGTAESERMGGAKAGQLYQEPLGYTEKVAATREAGLTQLAAQTDKGDEEKGVPLPTDIARSIDPTGGLDGLKVPFKDIISLINGKPGKDNILQVIEERYNPKVSPARAKELDAVITRYQHITQPVNFGTIGDPNSMGSKMVRKTSSGNEYVNGAGLSKKDFGEATKQLGIKQGIPVFDKDQVDKLKNIEISRDSIKDMWNQIKSKLPKDAQGRITAGPNNMLKAYMQSDAVLGAWKSWNDAHLRNMQSLADTKGFRNLKQINIAIEDNAFGPTDTIGVAAQKASNLLRQYDNIEKEFFRAYSPE